MRERTEKARKTKRKRSPLLAVFDSRRAAAFRRRIQALIDVGYGFTALLARCSTSFSSSGRFPFPFPLPASSLSPPSPSGLTCEHYSTHFIFPLLTVSLLTAHFHLPFARSPSSASSPFELDNHPSKGRDQDAQESTRLPKTPSRNCHLLPTLPRCSLPSNRPPLPSRLSSSRLGTRTGSATT
jgi:hypothetical protein